MPKIPETPVGNQISTRVPGQNVNVEGFAEVAREIQNLGQQGVAIGSKLLQVRRKAEVDQYLNETLVKYDEEKVKASDKFQRMADLKGNIGRETYYDKIKQFNKDFLASAKDGAPDEDSAAIVEAGLFEKQRKHMLDSNIYYHDKRRKFWFQDMRQKGEDMAPRVWSWRAIPGAGPATRSEYAVQQFNTYKDMLARAQEKGVSWLSAEQSKALEEHAGNLLANSLLNSVLSGAGGDRDELDQAFNVLRPDFLKDRQSAELFRKELDLSPKEFKEWVKERKSGSIRDPFSRDAIDAPAIDVSQSLGKFLTPEQRRNHITRLAYEYGKKDQKQAAIILDRAKNLADEALTHGYSNTNVATSINEVGSMLIQAPGIDKNEALDKLDGLLTAAYVGEVQKSMWRMSPDGLALELQAIDDNPDKVKGLLAANFPTLVKHLDNPQRNKSFVVNMQAAIRKKYAKLQEELGKNAGTYFRKYDPYAGQTWKEFSEFYAEGIRTQDEGLLAQATGKMRQFINHVENNARRIAGSGNFPDIKVLPDDFVDIVKSDLEVIANSALGSDNPALAGAQMEKYISDLQSVFSKDRIAAKGFQQLINDKALPPEAALAIQLPFGRAERAEILMNSIPQVKKSIVQNVKDQGFKMDDIRAAVAANGTIQELGLIWGVPALSSVNNRPFSGFKSAITDAVAARIGFGTEEGGFEVGKKDVDYHLGDTIDEVVKQYVDKYNTIHIDGKTLLHVPNSYFEEIPTFSKQNFSRTNKGKLTTAISTVTRDDLINDPRVEISPSFMRNIIAAKSSAQKGFEFKNREEALAEYQKELRSKAKLATIPGQGVFLMIDGVPVTRNENGRMVLHSIPFDEMFDASDAVKEMRINELIREEEAKAPSRQLQSLEVPSGR